MRTPSNREFLMNCHCHKTSRPVPPLPGLSVYDPSQSRHEILRSTVTNAYNFLDIELGRFMAQNLFIGAFYDFVTLHNLHNGVFWDEMENANYPSPIDSWVLNPRGTGLVVNQMDALEIDNFFVFYRSIGINLTFSPDLTESGIRMGWGTGGDIDLERVQYGIIGNATNQPGLNLRMYKCVRLPARAGRGPITKRRNQPSRRNVNGGSARGSWALCAFPPPAAGYLTILNLI
jgi:hypothetical protein